MDLATSEKKVWNEVPASYAGIASFIPGYPLVANSYVHDYW